MAHHVSAAETPRRSLVPRSPLARVAAASAVAAVAALALGAVAVFGGLETADAGGETEPPSTEMSNILYSITPHEAQLVTTEYGFQIDVRADVELDGSDEPVSTSTVGSIMVARVLPGGQEIKFPRATHVRYPGREAFDFQPHMRDETVLTWSVSDNPLLGDLFGDLVGTEDGDGGLFGTEDEAAAEEEEISPEDVESIEITLHEAEQIRTRDGDPLWVNSSAVVGVVELPVERN